MVNSSINFGLNIIMVNLTNILRNIILVSQDQGGFTRTVGTKLQTLEALEHSANRSAVLPGHLQRDGLVNWYSMPGKKSKELF